MGSDVHDFVARNADSKLLHFADLVLAIRTGQVKPLSRTEAPSENLARTYSIRSSIAREQGRTEVASEFSVLAGRCKANAGSPCKVWLFDGSQVSYAAFELQPSKEVVACIRFNGPLASSGLDA